MCSAMFSGYGAVRASPVMPPSSPSVQRSLETNIKCVPDVVTPCTPIRIAFCNTTPPLLCDVIVLWFDRLLVGKTNRKEKQKEKKLTNTTVSCIIHPGFTVYILAGLRV